MTASGSNSHTSQAGDERLRREGERIEVLLDELRGMTPAPTYQRIEELLQRVVRLYGAGLERLLGMALSEGTSPHELAYRICADELVAGLLLIHGLHPEPPGQRIRAALRRFGGRVELREIDEQGVAQLRAGGSGRVDAAVIERAVLDAAPELTGVVIDGAASDPELVQIRSRGRR